MKEVSVFVDESGDLGTESRRYLVCLVFHDQAESIEEQVHRYNNALPQSGLNPCVFHFGPLLNGHEAYEGLDISTRKRYLSKFMVVANDIAWSNNNGVTRGIYDTGLKHFDCGVKTRGKGCYGKTRDDLP